MPEEYMKIWRRNYLKAIKKAYNDGDISKSSYIELRKIVNE